MAGIGAWIAAMENWRTAGVEKPMRATKDMKILGWMLHMYGFLLGDPASLLQKRRRGVCYCGDVHAFQKNPYHFAVESDTFLLLQLKSL